MATSKPRITITLDKHVHQLLQRLSVLQRKSMSSIVTELLEAVSPSFERVGVLMQRAQGAQREALDGVAAALDRGEEVLRELLPSAAGMAQRDLFERARAKVEDARLSGGASLSRLERRAVRLGIAADACAPRGARASAVSRSGVVSDPRPVNTGVRSGKTQQNQRGRFSGVLKKKARKKGGR